MKALVIGPASHLGEALSLTLAARGDEVIGLDRRPSPHTTHVGDITNRAVVARCMAGVEAVFHAATLHKPHLASHSRQDFIDTNVSGALTLLEAASAAGVRALIFTSTTSVYGDALTPAPRSVGRRRTALPPCWPASPPADRQ
jgi:nucleoside-diphosphate-sugar epimerase